MLSGHWKSMVPAISLLLLLSFEVQGQTSGGTCQDIKKTLVSLRRRDDSYSGNLSHLFQIGDECIGNIISSLNDPDLKINIAAQGIIRYLGNKQGLQALETWNLKNQKSYPVWGPVTTPISKFDYLIIETYLLDKEKGDPGLVFSPYIYALAIDNSPKAKSLLQTVFKEVDSFNEPSISKTIVERLKSNYPLKPFAAAIDLAAAVLENAFFLDAEDKKFTTARLLSFNSNKDKALIELHLSRGVFHEVWYHVIVKKEGHYWKFFSIDFVGQS
jgi:hypothetical protein